MQARAGLLQPLKLRVAPALVSRQRCRLAIEESGEFAVVTQAKVIKKILKHLGLPSEVVLKETQPVWRVRGPPGELFPEDVAETGLDLAVDDDFGMDCVDELPVDDWAA